MDQDTEFVRHSGLSEEYYRYRIARRQRLVFVVITAVGVVALTGSMTSQFFVDRGEFTLLLLSISGVAFTLLAFLYLQRSPEIRQEGAESLLLFEGLDNRVDSLSNQVNRIGSELKKLAAQGAAGGALDVKKRQELVEVLKDEVQERAGDELIESLRSKAKQEARERVLWDVFERTAVRIREEVEALSRRGNLNLLLGMASTLVGISVLAYAVFTSDLGRGATREVLNHYIPRLSLALFVQVFAYFFLRLYKSSLAEIKYFQNELTNLEARFIAVVLARQAGDKDAFGSVLEQLAATERNFVLEKGQTTVELERERSSRETFVEAAQILGEALNKKDSK